MDDHLPPAERVVGFNQTVKLLRLGKIESIYLAYDADREFRAKVIAAAGEVPVNNDYSSGELSARLGIDVPCAVAAEVKRD